MIMHNPLRRMSILAVAVLVSAGVSVVPARLASAGGTGAGGPDTFPPASPESQGMDPAALAQLAEVVRGYIDSESALGAELLVIKNRRTVLHEAFGWKDRETDQPMVKHTLFNIRSMSKPFTGAAVQMLIDRGLVTPTDPIAKFLPGFDNENSSAITVEQVLAHRSGLPLSVLLKLGQGMDTYDTLQDMANATGEEGPEFEIDSKFWYSDSGTDVMGALVEVVSGTLLNEFWQAEFFDPLGMADTFVPLDSNDPRYERIASLYGGAPTAWSRFWSPESEPFYPYTWGSQSIYSTPMDYANFLAMWMDAGMAGDRRLLSAEAIQRTLTPVSRMSMLGSDARAPTEYTGLEVWYGQMAQLYMPVDDPAGSKPVIIGHSGSDGTVAAAWPAEDLMVLYFTQSRGGTSVLRIQESIDRLLLHPERVDVVEEVPEEFRRYLGTYVANFGPYRETEFTVVIKNGHLAVDVPRQLVFELKDPDEEGKRYFALTDAVAVTFDEDDDGGITGMKMYQSGTFFELPRGTAKEIVDPPLDLELAERLVGTYLNEDGDDVREVKVFINNGNLALQPPDVPVALDLYTPDSDGYWVVRLDTSTKIRFDQDENGNIISFTAVLRDGREFVRTRVAGKDDDP